MNMITNIKIAWIFVLGLAVGFATDNFISPHFHLFQFLCVTIPFTFLGVILIHLDGYDSFGNNTLIYGFKGVYCTIMGVVFLCALWYLFPDHPSAPLVLGLGAILTILNSIIFFL